MLSSLFLAKLTVRPFILTTYKLKPSSKKTNYSQIQWDSNSVTLLICSSHQSIFVSYLLSFPAVCLLRNQMPVQLIYSSQEGFSSLQNIWSLCLLKFAVFCGPKINNYAVYQF